MTPETVTLKDMAAELGVTAGMLRHQIRTGALTPMGRSASGGHLVSRAEVERYRRESRGRPGSRNPGAGGLARAAKLTPERRSEIGRMGAAAARERRAAEPG